MLTAAIIVGAIGWILAALLWFEPGRAPQQKPSIERHPGDRARR